MLNLEKKTALKIRNIKTYCIIQQLSVYNIRLDVNYYLKYNRKVYTVMQKYVCIELNATFPKS